MGVASVNHNRSDQRLLANPSGPNVKEKTTFVAPSGLYPFVKMPFALHSATALFQRVMDKTLKEIRDCAVTYIDDILVF